MNKGRPDTIPEWEEYVASFTGVELREQAIGANSLLFVEDLQGEGYSGKDIVRILTMFAHQLELEGQPLPQGIPGQYLSYESLVD